MYCNNCKKEVNTVGSICPYCGKEFTEEQINNSKTAAVQAEDAAIIKKSKAAALLLNYIFWGVGGMAYLGFKQLAKHRVIEWIRAFALCLTVIGILFAIPKMIKLFISPISDLKNIFSGKNDLINDNGEMIIWK